MAPSLSKVTELFMKSPQEAKQITVLIRITAATAHTRIHNKTVLCIKRK